MTKLSVVGNQRPMNQGEFEIIASLGAGATAEVFKARNRKADRYVALKSFLSFVSQDAASLKRLRDEIQILKTFDHPNVVKMIGEHMLDNQLCLELELVEGYDLREWMEESRNPLIEVDLWILVQIARGLGAVHEKGIIHRDLKPENVLISKEGDVKLSDFGLAKELNRMTMTRLGLLVGSLGYMAPEVTEGEKSCIKSDLFSFGAIAYELLSGQAPISGETAQAMIKNAMEPATPLGQVSPHVPPRIARLVDQCLKLDKTERPESIWAVESELMGYLNGTGLLPHCRELLKEKPDHKVLKKSLISKQQHLKSETEKVQSQKKPNKKKVLSLINEYQRLYPEDPTSNDLMELLRKQKAFRWPHPLVWAPLLLIFAALGIYSFVDWQNFKQAPPVVKTEATTPVVTDQKPPLKANEAIKKQAVSKPAPVKKEVAKKAPKKRVTQKPKPTVAKPKKVEPKINRPAVVNKAAMGKISFEVDDDVQIFVDEKLLTTAQLQSYSVKAGSHKVKMVKKGFMPIENEIFVKQGKTTTIRAKGGIMSQQNWQLCLIGPKGTQFVEVRGLMAVGGEMSTGVTVAGLKQKDDYLILSPTPQGVSIHCLKGKKSETNIQLASQCHFQLLDLTLLLLPEKGVTQDENGKKDMDRFTDDIKVLVQKFSQPGDLKGSMELLLETMISAFEMDKGLVIASNPQGEFKMLAEENIGKDESWLSETLIQQTITNQRPTIIQNIIGSRFEKSKSLMGTGFMSVCAWPLCVRGEVLGVLMIGSDRPHSGLDGSQTLAAEAYVQLAALMLKFYLNDLILKKEVETLRNSHQDSQSPLTTNDEDLQQNIKLAEQLANTELSLLIQGETGVGKEVMAKWIHKMSERADKDFVAVNCGAIPGELLESLLFGHRKGAFTGAVKDQKGKFLQANGGTLFLDEIGDLPGPLQVKILRALQEKSIEPLGSEKAIDVDARILCATHKNLKELVEKGEFRQDLYYRLAEVSFEIPPLRQRREDVSLIANQVLNQMNSDKRFSAEAIHWLQSQEWPGNVRELLSAIKRAIALCGSDVIQVQHLLIGSPQDRSSQAASWLGGDNLEDAKNNFVMEKVKLALRKTNNKRTQAAELLGVTPRTLFRYLENMDV